MTKDDGKPRSWWRGLPHWPGHVDKPPGGRRPPTGNPPGPVPGTGFRQTEVREFLSGGARRTEDVARRIHLARMGPSIPFDGQARRRAMHQAHTLLNRLERQGVVEGERSTVRDGRAQTWWSLASGQAPSPTTRIRPGDPIPDRQPTRSASERRRGSDDWQKAGGPSAPRRRWGREARRRETLGGLIHHDAGSGPEEPKGKTETWEDRWKRGQDQRAAEAAQRAAQEQQGGDDPGGGGIGLGGKMELGPSKPPPDDDNGPKDGLGKLW